MRPVLLAIPTRFLSLILACAMALAAADSTEPQGPDAALIRLLADGKAAAARFTADHAANASAIVDAAVAFETADKLITASTDQVLVTDIQRNLFWCRKQMNLDALTAFRARMHYDNPTAATQQSNPRQASPRQVITAPPAPPRQVAAPSADPPTTPAKVAPKAGNTAPGHPSPETLAAWSGRLRQRISIDLAAGRQPQFRSAFLESITTISALAEDGTLSVVSNNGGMQMPWKLLGDKDLVSLALDLTREDVPEQHALAAFYLHLSGDHRAAQLRLAKAGAAGDEVAAIFSTAH